MVCISKEFSNIYKSLVDVGVIRPEYIMRYDVASESSLHSILQYILIRSGIECGFISIPEYKIRLKKPIDRFSLDPRLMAMRKRRYQRSVTVDVAFFRDSYLVGVGEIYTLDEIHGCLPSNMLEEPQVTLVTPYHKLQSILENYKPKLLVIVNVFPTKLEGSLRWKDSRKKSVPEWREECKKFVKTLRRGREGLEVHHIEVNENYATEIR